MCTQRSHYGLRRARAGSGTPPSRAPPGRRPVAELSRSCVHPASRQLKRSDTGRRYGCLTYPSNPTPLHRLCAYNRQADLERRDGVDGILAEFRAAENLEPDMLRLVECFPAERALID